MAGAWRKAGLYLGLVEDDETRYDDGYDEDFPEEPAPARSRERYRDRPAAEPRPTQTAVFSARRGGDDHRTHGSVALEPTPRVAQAVAPYEELNRIFTLHPQNYNEAKTIGERFRDGTPVIMNLTEMADGDAKRLVDFAAGLTFGVHGSLERITNKVFLLSPEHVEVTAEDKARFAESGFFNQS
jgi:cell division inhibitor SepF